MRFEGFEFLALGGDEVVKGAEAIGDFLLFGFTRKIGGISVIIAILTESTEFFAFNCITLL